MLVQVNADHVQGALEDTSLTRPIAWQRKPAQHSFAAQLQEKLIFLLPQKIDRETHTIRHTLELKTFCSD